MASSSAFIRTMCLPLRERLEHDLRAELDRAGEVDEDVDLLGAAEQERVVGDDGAVRADRVLDLGLAGRDDGVAEPGVVADAQGLLEPAGVDRRHAHAGDAVGDLVRQPLGHEAGADQRDPDRAALCLAPAQCGVDEDHSAALAVVSAAIRDLISSRTSASGAQSASFSEISVTGSGQLRPRSGSNGDRPPSADGV